MENNIGSIIKKMILYFDGDVRRINHALKVYGFSKSIGQMEGLNNHEMAILEVSSVLHDIGIKVSEEKYGSSSGRYQEIEGPQVARELLAEFDFSIDFIDRVCHLIGNHHTYSKIDNIDFQILVEADFLVNIYEDNIKQSQIDTLKKKYFKTEIGRCYLDSMYK